MQKEFIKIFKVLALCLIFTITGYNQTQAQNPILPTTGKNSIVTYQPADPHETVDALKSSVQERQGATIQYFDGLGRLEQTIQVKGTTNLLDMVQPVVYDELGREAESFLPYEAITGVAGEYRPEAIWRPSQGNFYEKDLPGEKYYTYSYSQYEASPLNRVLWQRGPGKDWEQNNKVVSYTYGTNISNDVRFYRVTLDKTLLFDGHYEAGKLTLLETTDEDGRVVQEYKDFQDRVVLSRAYSGLNKTGDKVETYYTYDDLNRLRFVIPPLAAAEQTNGQEVRLLLESIALPPLDTYTNSYVAEGDAQLKLLPGFSYKATTANPLSLKATSGLMYYYEYDERGRVTLKKLPGANPMYLAYDKLDRLVLQQDGEMRKTNQWTAITYDAFGREIKTGLVTLPGVGNNQAEAQSWINNNPNGLDAAITAGTLLTHNVYDTYPTSHSALTYLRLINLDMPSSPSSRTRGMITAGEVRVLNPETGKPSTLKSKTFYDKDGRVLQTVSELYDGGVIRQSFKYSWSGLVLNEETRIESCPIPNVNIKLERKMAYDHAGRLTTVEQRVNGQAWNEMANTTYDALGRMLKQAMGRDGSLFVQEVDYAYNIRGWLTAINNPDDMVNDLFAMNLSYQTLQILPTATGDPAGAPQFSGNITEMDWAYRNENTQLREAYRFWYDGLNRLTAGRWFEKAKSWARHTDRFDTRYSYDLQGNIQTLSRYGVTTDGFNLIDNLSYTYDANRLLGVADATVKDDGYADINKSIGDFSYNANGSMSRDMDKGITVTYNTLNLPQQVSVSGSNSVTYVYTATGAKLAALYRNGTTLQGGNRYVGPLVLSYDNNSWTPDYISTAEGRLKYGDGTTWTPQYFVKDHLGNIRAIAQHRGTTDPTMGIAQQVWQQSYYPFGMTLGTPFIGQPNQLTYNGKERQDYSLNGRELEWLDYGARIYDPALGRWHVIDPMAHEREWLSPYNFCSLDPINRVDPDGALDDEWDYDVGTGNLEWKSDKGGSETQYVNVKQDGKQVGQASVSGDKVFAYKLKDDVVITNKDREFNDKTYNRNFNYEYSLVEFKVRNKYMESGSVIKTAILQAEEAGKPLPITYNAEENKYGYTTMRVRMLGLAISTSWDAMPTPSPSVRRVGRLSLATSSSISSNLTGTKGATALTGKTSWNKFLQATKGNYSGKGWQQKAAADYYKSSFYKP